MLYHDLSQREYELTKHVSLLQIDPIALVQLRATGTCSFTLPEEAFDLDCPGHYFRRIKSVTLSVPCVAGPYTSVNCTLTLQKSAIRIITHLPNNKYARQGPDDIRFNDYFGTVQSIVTSSALADSGLFELNLGDERYLPFEGAGIAGSQWQLTLPFDVPQFDYDTITDVILHIRYTAREGGQALKAAAVANLQKRINNAQTVGSVRLFSIRHDFPSEWAKFRDPSVNPAAGRPTAALALTLLPQHYPFWSQSILGKSSVKRVQFFGEMLDKSASVKIYDDADPTKAKNSDSMSQNSSMGGLLIGTLAKIPLPTAITSDPRNPYMLFFDNNSMKELWMAITWGKG